ncbi:MAG: hypothetical protein HPY69_01965 [Armatimonadetes bacterium]|nr:hypothetical protein [Armatimonadota bacterium]
MIDRPPNELGEDDVLDIELDDVPEPPVPAPPPPVPATDEVLEITLEDLAEEACPASAEYPAVTEQQAALGKPGVIVPCICSATGQHFEVRFEESEPGVYRAVEAVRTAPADAKAAGPGAMASVAGTFRMGPDYRCPYCGDGALSICEVCEAVLCLGATDKPGDCQCPGCHAILTATGGPATAAPALGKEEGKPGKAW